MDQMELKGLLTSLQNGDLSVDEALTTLRDFPVADMGYARIDTHRTLRRGFPETILAEGKSIEQLVGIVQRCLEQSTNLLVTRTSEIQRKVLKENFHHPAPTFHPPSTLAVFEQKKAVKNGKGTIGVLSAGTSDIPVAREAIETARLFGNEVIEIFDVGVAGLHRLLGELPALRECSVVIVVAGMDGALPSVVGGLLDVPVIAVPTSVGYGSSFEGLAALLSMLNACASGVVVVNIDNGFGAAMAASMMNEESNGSSS